jgi:PAS domain S-box-containing protein
MQENLRKSEIKFQNILENTTDAVVVTNFNGKHIYMSPNYTKLLGYSEIEDNGINFDYVHPDDRKK